MTGGGEPRGWRCFVAVPVSDDLRAHLSAAVERWRDELDARWTDPATWHATLDFVASIPPERVEELRASLADALTSHESFTITAGGLGAFPSERRARVLYYRIQDESRRLERLAAAATAATSRVVGARERAPFRGHLTLARLRYPHRLDGWLRGQESPTSTFEATEAYLMRSHLGGGPARYEVLGRFPLQRIGHEAA